MTESIQQKTANFIAAEHLLECCEAGNRDSDKAQRTIIDAFSDLVTDKREETLSRLNKVKVDRDSFYQAAVSYDRWIAQIFDVLLEEVRFHRDFALTESPGIAFHGDVSSESQASTPDLSSDFAGSSQ